jgi:hypothetical protein
MSASTRRRAIGIRSITRRRGFWKDAIVGGLLICCAGRSASQGNRAEEKKEKETGACYYVIRGGCVPAASKCMRFPTRARRKKKANGFFPFWLASRFLRGRILEKQ